MKKNVSSKRQSDIIGEYPIVDGHRRHYVKTPAQLRNGKWVAVRVCIEGGYLKADTDIDSNPTIVQFDKESECQKGCDIHNNYHFNPENTIAGEDRILEIITASFLR